MEVKTHLEYLTTLSAKLKLSPTEITGIESSLEVVKSKLQTYFSGEGLIDIKPFGSFDRGTLLTRKVDTESDVDILVMFDEKRWEAQTYLNKLKQFANDNYTRSEIYQDHPTIVIELTKIKFELTPCIFRPETATHYEKYLIPQKKNPDLEWISTKPNYLKKRVNEFVKTRETLINLILLYKYWNIINGRLYKTHQVEEFVIHKFDYGEDLRYNFYKIINALHYRNDSNVQNDLNRVIKKQKSNIEYLLDGDLKEYAMMELQKILPDFN